MSHFLTPLLATSHVPLRLRVRDREAPLATVVETAFDSSSRNRGLLGRDTLADNVAFVIAPTSAVHTFGMRFPIDIVYCAKNGRVLKVRSHVRPSRISMCVGAFAVIEMAAGAAEGFGLEPDMVLYVGPSDDDTEPR